MSWSFDNTKPIYLQIMEKIKLQIVSPWTGTQSTAPYRERFGERGWVNPNTIQRALSDLEREGFVYSKRTTGRLSPRFGPHPSVPQTTFRGATATLRLLHASIWLQKKRTAKMG